MSNSYIYSMISTQQDRDHLRYERGAYDLVDKSKEMAARNQIIME